MSSSPLDFLKGRREALLAEQLHDMQVPLWNMPVLRLRIKPVDHGTFARIMKVAGKAPTSQMAEAQLNGNAAIIAAALVKVLIGDGEDRAEVDWQDMLESMGLPETATCTSLVRALCLRDGDVLSLAEAVMKHSGYSQTAADEALAGE